MSDRCFAARPVVGTGITPGPGIKNLPGAQTGGTFCEIEGQVIPANENHHHACCTGPWADLCTTWRAHKERRWKDRDSDVAALRSESIARRHGPADPVADAVIAGEAPIETMLERG